MAEQPAQTQLTKNWVRVIDEKSGCQADFPYPPLEMTFDHPFKNTPPDAQARLYSVPTQKGLLVLCAFHSKSADSISLEKSSFLHFFEAVLAPHFFYDPSSFQHHQAFHFSPCTFKGREAASFQFSFQQGGEVKKLKGMALRKDSTLFIPFCLSSEKDFDEGFFTQFLDTVQIP